MARNPQPELFNINALRRMVVSQAFTEGIGEKAFIMTPDFPFVFIGIIAEVQSDFVILDTETTNISALDDLVFRIHLDDITVFYIENGGPKIPKIKQ